MIQRLGNTASPVVWTGVRTNRPGPCSSALCSVSRATHHVQIYLMPILNLLGPFVGIGAIHIHSLDRGVFGSRLVHRFGGRIPILPVRGADTHGQEQAQGIHQKATLAPLYFLAGIVAAAPPPR